MRKYHLETSGFKGQMKGGGQLKKELYRKVGIKSDEINDMVGKVGQSAKLESGQLMPSGLK